MAKKRDLCWHSLPLKGLPYWCSTSQRTTLTWTCDALALALQAYAGAVLIVADDLLENCRRLWVVEEGGLPAGGDLNQYTASRLSNTTSGPYAQKQRRPPTTNQKEQRRARHIAGVNCLT